MECIYAMQSFGIVAKDVPIHVATGELQLGNHNRWLELCSAKEENPKLRKRIIECPNYSDVLFGRGQIVMNHPGNIMFRDLIQSKLDVYKNVQSKKESTQWTWEVLRMLKNEYGARFLKEERIGNDIFVWVEVSNETARTKVRIAFRDARTRLSKSSVKGNGPSKLKGNKKDTSASSLRKSSSQGPITSLPKRTNGKTSTSGATCMFVPPSTQREHQQQFRADVVTLEGMSNDLNHQIHHQFNDSSTFAFLGYDSSSSKRHRIGNPKLFDCE